MELKKYIEERGQASILAKKVGVSLATVSFWASNDRFPSVANCKKIEFITGGKVRCEELRPDLNWDYIRSRAA